MNPALEYAVSARPERVEGRCRDWASTGSARTVGSDFKGRVNGPAPALNASKEGRHSHQQQKESRQPHADSHQPLMTIPPSWPPEFPQQGADHDGKQCAN